MIGMLSLVKDNLSRYSHINWALADQIMVSGVNFLTGILIARYLGLNEYGRFTLIWMVILFCNSFQQAGIIAPMMSFGPKQALHDEPTYYGSVILLQLAFSLLCFTLLYFGITFSKLIFSQWAFQDLGFPLAVTLLACQLQDFLRRYYFIRRHGKLAFINDAISYLGQLTALIVLFRWVHLDVAGVLWIISLTSAAAVFIGAHIISSLRFSRKHLHIVVTQHWENAKWLVGAALIQWTSGNFFIISLGAVAGSQPVGALRAAQNIMGVTHVLFQAMENIVPSSAARNLQIGGLKAMKAYLWRVGRLCTGATALFCLLVAVAPNKIFSFFYNDSYKDYGYLLWWFIPTYLLISVGLPLRAGLRSLDKTRPIFIAYVLITVFALLSAVPIIRAYGISGAMLGILITHLIFQGYITICLVNIMTGENK